MTGMRRVPPEASAAAWLSRTYPRLSTALLIRARNLSETAAGLLRARETLIRPTPANLATSSRRTRPVDRVPFWETPSPGFPGPPDPLLRFIYSSVRNTRIVSQTLVQITDLLRS